MIQYFQTFFTSLIFPSLNLFLSHFILYGLIFIICSLFYPISHLLQFLSTLLLILSILFSFQLFISSPSLLLSSSSFFPPFIILLPLIFLNTRTSLILFLYFQSFFSSSYPSYLKAIILDITIFAFQYFLNFHNSSSSGRFSSYLFHFFFPYLNLETYT